MAKKKSTKVKKKAKTTKLKKTKVSKAKKTKKMVAKPKTKPKTKPKAKPKAKSSKKKVAKPSVKKKVTKAAAAKTTKKQPAKDVAAPEQGEGGDKKKRKMKLTQSTRRSTSSSTNRFAVPYLTPKVNSEHHEPLTIEQLRKIKTDLTKRDLDHFRELLLKKRAVILGDVETMEKDVRTKNEGGDLSNVPVHMADVGSDNYEQEFTLGLVESERRLLKRIDGALHRLQDRIYGVCIERGIPIGRERLEAKPWAKYCIEVARERERMGQE